MATVTETPPQEPPQERPRSRRATPAPLKVSAYDKAASMLTALLLLVGVFVVMMFIIWLTNRIFSHNVAVPIIMEELTGGDPSGVLGESLKIDAPIREEIAQETDLEEPEISEAVELITDVAAKLMVDLDDPNLDEAVEGGKAGGAEGEGDTKGLGEGGTGSGVPRHLRWRILYDDTTLGTYARQLDHFGIELASISGRTVTYASGFSGRPNKRTGLGKDEDRLYMSWKGGTLQKFDQQLLQKAGVPTAGRITVQFYPLETENKLAVLERDYRDREAKFIRRTTFGVRPQGNGYEYFVIDQELL